MFYLYFLYSKTGNKFYVGSSSDPWQRLIQHNSSSQNTFTSKYRPWELVAIFEAGNSRSKAESYERFIKNQKSRRLIKKLINPDFKPDGLLAQMIRVPHLRD
ncbi:GIY-YIG nuclease family protein [Gangjinia marincola]|uniref:GIY-YIG nuclease family protein n=1 Tax=Gangjinia marincola TaxID=578463 RepID=UPI0031D89D8D